MYDVSGCSELYTSSSHIPTFSALDKLHNQLSQHKLTMDGDLVGPAIPPHILAKRKRRAEEEAAAAAAATKEVPRSPAEDSDNKKRRTAGPAPPPALIEERPYGNPSDDDSSSDDEIGPSMPPGPGSEVCYFPLS